MKTVKLYQPRREAVAKPREFRESRHARGYDYEWTKEAGRFIRQHPICHECERGDIIVPSDVVDHKIPISQRPALRMERRNWWALCHHCHQGIKKRMEAYAIKAGKVDSLIMWCDEPQTRPAALTRASRKRAKEEYVV